MDVYGLKRTSESLTDSPLVSLMFFIFSVLYVLLTIVTIVTLRSELRILPKQATQAGRLRPAGARATQATR